MMGDALHHHKRRQLLKTLASTIAAGLAGCTDSNENNDTDVVDTNDDNTTTQRLRQAKEYPRYWEYNGEPRLLLGATDTDSLFQWGKNPDKLRAHLDDQKPTARDRSGERDGSSAASALRHLLSHRGPDECYLMADRGRIYAVYFPSGGQVRLDISAMEDPGYVRWLETDTVEWDGDWTEAQHVGDGTIKFNASGYHWMVNSPENHGVAESPERHWVAIGANQPR